MQFRIKITFKTFEGHAYYRVSNNIDRFGNFVNERNATVFTELVDVQATKRRGGSILENARIQMLYPGETKWKPLNYSGLELMRSLDKLRAI